MLLNHCKRRMCNDVMMKKSICQTSAVENNVEKRVEIMYECCFIDEFEADSLLCHYYIASSVDWKLM